MLTNIEYALMAANVYDAVRTDENDIRGPQGWTRIRYIADGPLAPGGENQNLGFSAGVFRRDNEVVVSFTGTNEVIDWWTNINVNTVEGNDSANTLRAETLDGQVDNPLLQAMRGAQPYGGAPAGGLRSADQERLWDRFTWSYYRNEVSTAQILSGNGAFTFTSGAGDTLSGNGDDDRLVGGWDNDTLIGGEGNDVLIDSAGADVMAGGAGDDTYVVDQGFQVLDGADSLSGTLILAFSDSSVDLLIENAGEGADTVVSAVDFTLADNFENLTLVNNTLAYTDDYSDLPVASPAPRALVGTGNAADNVITGNSRSNQLYGLGGDDTLSDDAGNDSLDGGEAADTMTAGAGNDVYIVNNAGDQYADGDDCADIQFGENVSTTIHQLTREPLGTRIYGNESV